MSANYSKNLHAILGVDEKAGPDELRKAYLHLAVKYHPDRNPGDPEAEERFKDISQAYAILSDPAARSRYERLRARKNGAAKPSAGTGSASSRTAGARPSSAGTGAKARPSGASAGTAGRASASAGASAGTKSTSSGAGTGQSSTKSGTAGASSRAGAGASAQGERGPDSTGSAKNENFKSTGTSSSAERESADGDFDEILNNFFKTDKGRETLRDLEGELGKAGIKFKAEDFAQWVKEKQQPPKASTSTEKRGGSLWHKLTSWLPGSEAREQKKAERYDINYQITITPQVAATGTTVEISYQRDDKPHRLSIKIPAGTRDGARLRLGEQGRLKPDQTRGALILTVQVQQPQTVADLWR